MKFSLVMSSTLQTIHKLQSMHNKNYCYPSQKKILKLLERFYNIKIKRRQLNYVLAYLEREEFIDRKRRLKKSKDGKIVFNTTLYWLKKKSWCYIAKVYGAIKNTGFKLKEAMKKENKKKIPLNESERYLVGEEQRRKNLEQLRLIFERF